MKFCGKTEDERYLLERGWGFAHAAPGEPAWVTPKGVWVRGSTEVVAAATRMAARGSETG